MWGDLLGFECLEGLSKVFAQVLEDDEHSITKTKKAMNKPRAYAIREGHLELGNEGCPVYR